ncbi:MAG: MFS transporter [Leptospirales bacterium]
MIPDQNASPLRVGGRLPLSDGQTPVSFLPRLKWERILQNNRFKTLLVAFTISQLSEGMTQTALTWIAFRLSHNHIALVATIVFLQTLVPFFIIFPAGFLADRIPAPPLLAAVNLFKGATYSLLPLFALLGPLTATNIQAVVIITAIFSAFFNPAFNASLPSFVPKDVIKKANGWILIFGQGGYLLGPLTTGELLLHIKAPWIIFISGTGFVISAIILILIPPMRSTSVAIHDIHPAGFQLSHIQRDLQQIVLYLRDHPRIILGVFYLALFGLINASLPILFPLMSTQLFGMEKGFFSVLSGMYFSGSFLAGIIIIRATRLPAMILIPGGFLFSGLSILLLSMDTSAWLGPIILAFAGAGLSMSQPLVNEWIQKEIPKSLLGKTFSVAGMIFLVSCLIGIKGTGWLAHKWGIHFFLQWVGIVLAGVSVLLLIATHLLKSASKGNT